MKRGFLTVAQYLVLAATVAAGYGGSGRAAAEPQSSGTPAGIASLDYAFRFASAIVTDPKDQARAQEAVLQDFLRKAGATPEVLSRVDQVRGWRQGVLLADLAAAEARAGRKESARELIAKAEEVRAATSGWQGPRIEAHIAAALALLGEVKPAEKIAQELGQADPLQYRGRSAWTMASGLAARGEFEPAIQALAPLDGDPDLETAVWRTRGYITIGTESRFGAAQRLRALDAAAVSTRTMDGWGRVEALQEIAAQFLALSSTHRAQQTLQEAEAQMEKLQEAVSAKISLIASLARSWREAGNATRSRDLLKRAEPAAAQTLDIDRPGAYAWLASVRHELGDAKRAKQLYDQAFAAAESLKNARPRALAVVEICRCLARDGVDPEGALKTRLEALLGGLKDPW